MARKRLRQSELPFADDVLRWGRIQLAGQKFAAVILAETEPGSEQDLAIAYVRGAILRAQASGAPPETRAWIDDGIPITSRYVDDRPGDDAPSRGELGAAFGGVP